MKLTDERIYTVLGEAYKRLVTENGYNGGMGGETWDKAAARAIEAEVLRINGLGGEGHVPDGYALAMAVLQSDLYHRLDDDARAQCDAMLSAAQKPQEPGA